MNFPKNICTANVNIEWEDRHIATISLSFKSKTYSFTRSLHIDSYIINLQISILKICKKKQKKPPKKLKIEIITVYILSYDYLFQNHILCDKNVSRLFIVLRRIPRFILLHAFFLKTQSIFKLYNFKSTYQRHISNIIKR